jgi:hypothetical protein
MTRESLKTELKQQQEHLNRIRQFFHIDQSHAVLTRADEIQRLINEINDDLCHFPDAASYESINDALISNIKSQIDRLKNVMLVRN